MSNINGTTRLLTGPAIEGHYHGAQYFKSLTFAGRTLCRYQELFGKIIEQVKGTKRTFRVDIGFPIDARLEVGEFCNWPYPGQTVAVQVGYLRQHDKFGFQVGLRRVDLEDDFSTELFSNWCLENSRGVKYGGSDLSWGFADRYFEFDQFIEGKGYRRRLDGRFLTASNLAGLNAGATIQTVKVELYRQPLICSVDFFSVLPHILKAVTEQKVFTAAQARRGYNPEGWRYTGYGDKAQIMINGGKLYDGVDYDAVGALFVPEDQLEATMAKVKSNSFNFKLVMEDYEPREGWEERMLVEKLIEKPFLAVPVE